MRRVCPVLTVPRLIDDEDAVGVRRGERIRLQPAQIASMQQLKEATGRVNWEAVILRWNSYTSGAYLTAWGIGAMTAWMVARSTSRRAVTQPTALRCNTL